MMRWPALIFGTALLPAAAHADALQDRIVAEARAVPDAYAFRRTAAVDRTGAARRTVVESYDPRRPAAARWQLLSIDGRPPTAKEAAQAAKAKRDRPPSYSEIARWFGTPATRVASGPGTATYRFARLPAGIVKIGSHDASPETAVEATVNTGGPTPYVERIRFTSTAPFRMALVASVRSFTVQSRYRPGPDGRPVPLAQVSDMAGSLMGKSGQLRTEVAYTDVVRVR
jgi:hypothetical protein